MGWVIPPEQNSDFVANMENVLDVYKREYNEKYPVVCMDESPRQLIAETKVPIRNSDGSTRIDYEYLRKGICNIFIANEPLAGTRMVKITGKKTKVDWAEFVKDISDRYPYAEKITLVMEQESELQAFAKVYFTV